MLDLSTVPYVYCDNGVTKTNISNLKKPKQVAVLAIIIDNLQLKYWKVCIGRNYEVDLFNFLPETYLLWCNKNLYFKKQYGRRYCDNYWLFASKKNGKFVRVRIYGEDLFHFLHANYIKWCNKKTNLKKNLLSIVEFVPNMKHQHVYYFLWLIISDFNIC